MKQIKNGKSFSWKEVYLEQINSQKNTCNLIHEQYFMYKFFYPATRAFIS